MGERITDGVTFDGIRFTWSGVADGGNSIDFIQEVVVMPIVGATESNSVIRETHTVRNNGPGNFSFGLRKQWDFQIGFDDGPWFGDCQSATQACDVSMNMTAGGPIPYPQSYVINEEPASAGCPGAVVPVNSAGCPPGNPVYIVAGTVKPPSNLTPPPTAPELLQFNAWPQLFGNCWLPLPPVNNATCPGGDTAIAYFYGLTAGTAEQLAPGQQKSFTQYVVAGEESCPQALAPPVPTVSQWGMLVLALLLLVGLSVTFLRRREPSAT